MNGRASIWLLAAGLSSMTTMAAIGAFMKAGDRSPGALVYWGVIAVSLIAPLFQIPGLLSTTPRDPSALRRRCSRVLILTYLPLACALFLFMRGGW